MASEDRSIAAAGGPALFQGPDADHWARLLVREHLDAPGRLALLRTCQHARTLVLTNAAEFIVTLRLGVHDEDGPARCEAAQRLLRRRGGAHTTTLVLEADNSMTTLALLLHVMREEMGLIDTLELRGLSSDDADRPAISLALLQLLPRYWRPNLRSLRIFGAAGCIIDPALLPGLQELHIEVEDLDWPEVHANIAAPYAHRLRTLIMGESTLTGPQVLQLCKAAPNLVDLVVAELQLTEAVAELRERAVAWQRLTISRLRLSSLAYLPACDVTVILSQDWNEGVDICFDVDSGAGAEAVIAGAARATFWFHQTQVFMPGLPEEGENQDENQQVNTTLLFKHGIAAVRGLRGFGAGFKPPPELWLDKGWTLSREAVGHLQWLPPWTRLYFQAGALEWDDSDKYRSLLRGLPTSYRVIHFDCSGDHASPSLDQLATVCRGRPIRRFTIEIGGRPEVWVDKLRAKLDRVTPAIIIKRV